MTAEFSALFALELYLWDADKRFNRALMDATFAEDFCEVDRAGRRHTREQMLLDEDDRHEINARLHRFAVRPLSADLALATYVTEVQHRANTHWADRTSIWDRSSGRWRSRFHQATPTESLE